jgi:phospholipid/cholesterol/gamma-HCH transport system substrate-binding protein
MPSAARVSWAKFRVFIVSLAALVILSTLAALLTGGRLLQPKATLYLYVPDVTGLGQDSPVRVDGIDVGKVERVQLSGSNDPNRVVKITMTVERARLATIPADSYAELSTDSLIGDRYVDVTSGRATRSIAPGAEITYHVGE